jgi:hypothetical protein
MQLPQSRGPLSAALAEALRGGPPPSPPTQTADVLGDDDFQLALFLCHELHYGGIEGVDAEAEWDLGIVAFRLELERLMLTQLREEIRPPGDIPPDEVGDAIFELVERDDAPPLSRYVALRATLEQFREFVMHRSAYQLKEADPHTFAMPRVRGPAKAAMVEIQADEYGGGNFESMHSQLFAKTMRELGLDTTYGAYVHLLPGTTLATVNLISVFSLHRRWRGALVGHLAGFEITSPEPNRRYGNGLRRLGYGPEATEFYDEHVEADSVHEQIAAHDLAGGLARQEPALAPDVIFGVQALLHTEKRFVTHMLDSWKAGRSSLLEPAATAPRAAYA